MTVKIELNREDFLKAFNHKGFVVIENLLSTDFINQMKLDLLKAIDQEVAWHGTKNYSDYGMVLLCALYGGSFVKIFDQVDLWRYVEYVMGEGCILYAYTSSSLPPESKNYSTRIHVDCPRLIDGYITNMGVLIALDDFTKENGATWYLPESQKLINQPDESDFFSKAVQITMPAGSVCYFNARTWHSSAKNCTKNWRHAVSMNICRPFMKQRIDIPRALENRAGNLELSDKARQKLGFDSQVPTSYEEYYVPKEMRKFKQKTE